LTSLEMFGDNWAEVAENVGTKTQVRKEDQYYHFMLLLSIEIVLIVTEQLV